LLAGGLPLRNYYSSLDFSLDTPVDLASSLIISWQRGDSKISDKEGYRMDCIIVSARLRFNIILLNSRGEPIQTYQYWNSFDNQNTLLLVWHIASSLYQAAEVNSEEEFARILKEAAKQEKIYTEIATRSEYLSIKEESENSLIERWQTRNRKEVVPRLLRLLYLEHFGFPGLANKKAIAPWEKLQKCIEKLDLPTGNSSCYYFYGLEEYTDFSEEQGIEWNN
jgi:hypothetical protein